MGHEKRFEAIIENIIRDHEMAIMEVERNRVGKHIVMMLAEIATDSIGTIARPVKRKHIKNQKAYVVMAKGEYVKAFDDKANAISFRNSLVAGTKNLTHSDTTIETTTDERVTSSASPKLEDNEINVYIDGYAIRVQLNDQLMAEAYTNIGVEGLGAVLSMGRSLNSFLSKVYTGYNPEFILTNMIRDFSTGLINLTGEEGFHMAMKAVSNYARMFADLSLYAATNGKKRTKWIDMYRAGAGNTGAAYLDDMERLGNEIATEYASYQGVITNLKEGDMTNAARAAGRKTFNLTLKWVQNLNMAGENAMRLAAFKAMIDSGKTMNEASHVAKNITVNFNRKGTIGAEANAIYLFYNASVQGVAATSHALFKGKHKYQAWSLATSMTSLGYLAAAALGGGDEDEYNKVDDYTKSRNVLIKTEEGYAKIPIPYGYGFFWNLGRIIADGQRTGELDKAPWRIAAVAVEELTPFGDIVGGSEDGPESEQAFLGAMPTAAKIFAQPSFNRSSFSGSPIMPDSPYDRSQASREKMWRNTQGTANDIVAGWLETGLGIDVSPETLKHLVRTFTGGAGALVDTAVSSALLKSEGAELDARELPFLRKVYAELTISSDRSAFYKAAGEARTAAEELGRAKRNQDWKKFGDIASDKREMLAMHRYANSMSKFNKLLRDQQDAVRLSDDISVKDKRLKLKELEAVESKNHDVFLKVFKLNKDIMQARK